MDTMCHAVLVVHHISHWGFFRALGVAQLVGLGFPIGPATQIYNGALQLEETMTFLQTPDGSNQVNQFVSKPKGLVL
ncbi:hypothetical protein KEM48_012869 [Puccinia striiformis f. sp. tritici PST-130]|nr:hypothetical protein KEM48_012869 [Puccinia striiformis f. sp. tritici PST-130]